MSTPTFIKWGRIVSILDIVIFISRYIRCINFSLISVKVCLILSDEDKDVRLGHINLDLSLQTATGYLHFYG